MRSHCVHLPGVRSMLCVTRAARPAPRTMLKIEIGFSGLRRTTFVSTVSLAFNSIHSIDAAIAELIAQVNSHPHIKLRAAVDLPSGVGETNAATVFRADFTYATGIVKSPVITESSAAHVGRLRYLDLGFFDNVAGRAEPGSDHGLKTQSRSASSFPPSSNRSPNCVRRKPTNAPMAISSCLAAHAIIPVPY